MQLDFTGLFSSSSDAVCIDYSLSLEDFEYSTYKPLKNGARIIGRAYTKADVTHLDLNISFDFFGICDRCADDIERHYSFDISKTVVPFLENEEDDEGYVITENNILDIDDLVYQEIQLFLPHKMLCSDDCKGLCQVCGKNLNYGECDCKKAVDPRMAALLQLLDEQ